MTIQIKSDKTSVVDAQSRSAIENEVNRVLGRFISQLTRVDVHVSDVDGRKAGPRDIRCVIEARPAGSRPVSATASAAKVLTAVGSALRKMKQLLARLVDRRGWSVSATAPRVPKARAARVAVRVRKSGAAKTAVAVKGVARKPAVKKAVAKKAVAKKAAGRAGAQATSAGKKRAVAASKSAAKKANFQTRRKAWPSR